MSGAPGGGSGHDDDPFAVRPATDADRERPAQPLAPIGWGRPDGREPVPADRDAAQQDAGVDPAPADATQRPDADILAGIVPLDPTEDDERVAPLDQVDADQDAHDPDADLDAPAPEPGIADAPVDAGDVEFPGEPDPGYVPAPAADGPGEVLSGEVEADPTPGDDAPAEMVLEPVDDAQDGAALPVVPADAPVVDAELVEDPSAPAVPDDEDPVQLTPLRDDRMDEDAEVVDDPAGRVADEVEPQPLGGDVDAEASAGASAGPERDDEDAAPAPLAPAAAAARAAAMAWASGSAPAAAPAAAAAAPAAVPAEAAPAERADAAPTVDRPEDAPEPEAATDPETAAPSSPVVEPSDADRAPEHGAEPRDDAAPTARVPDPAPSSFAPPDASAAEPVDAISLLFGDVASDPASDRAHADAEDRPADPEDADDRTRILPAAAPAAAPPAAAAPRPDRDAPTVAVPAASPRPDPAPRPAPVPPPYAAPPAPRAPAPRAPVLDAARIPAPPAAAPPRGPRGPRRTGLWVGGAILLVLLLVGLFYLGQRLGSAAAPDAAPVATATPEATPTPSPTPTDPVQGPAAAGVQAWDALLGGECIDPYTTPWEEEFTVVDCGSEHHAQMVARVALPQTGDAFPGEEAVRDSADELCIADTVIDYAAARGYSDVQYQSAYPISQEEWAAGDRDAYCFVSRAGGGTFTSSIGKPQPPVVP
ncbi:MULTISPECIES: septum formation family protein [Clavibacter]|uniref:Septum formation family protein n=3 Tax=Clavibacter TaxID=1573 RepID=A0ABY3TC17_9MICO|nr:MULTISPECIES: septum formation family protein [Clavibacter]KDP91243.1 large membrane associated protein [Clavibacter cf. michiganensis LMG 26808]UKF25552.1 septum formation family protein [Clavibacter sp. A6099]